MHKVERGQRHNRQQRIMNGVVHIQIQNLLISPPHALNDSGEEFMFVVLVKREANSLVTARRQTKERGRENVFVEEEVQLHSDTIMQVITSGIEFSGNLGGCCWMITTGEYDMPLCFLLFKLTAKLNNELLAKSY